MTDRELLQQALDALKHLCLHSAAIKGYDGEQIQTAIDALKARLAQPEPEPTKLINVNGVLEKAGYIKKKEWDGLTREELAEIAEFHFHGALSGREFYDDVEAKLKEKNNG